MHGNTFEIGACLQRDEACLAAGVREVIETSQSSGFSSRD